MNNTGWLSISQCVFLCNILVSMYIYFTLLVDFIPEYFTPFDATVKGIFLAAFWDCSLCRGMQPIFCAFILYLAILLEFITSNSVFFCYCWHLGFSTYQNIFCKQIWFYFSFSIRMAFISFPCLNGLTRTSNTMLNRSSKVGNIVFFLKTWSLSPLSIKLALGFT